MPKEPRRGPAVLDGFTSDSPHGPVGRFSFSVRSSCAFWPPGPPLITRVHPNLFHIGPLFLPTYGLLVAGGLIAALCLSLNTAVRVGLSPDALWTAGLVTVISAFFLSRLLLILLNLHSFLTYPILLLTVPSLTPTGILLTALAATAYLHTRRIPLRPALDAWAPCATLLWAFLALGHLAEGSDLGLPASSHLLSYLPFVPKSQHPVSLYAALCALVLTALLLLTLPRAPESSSRDLAPAPHPSSAPTTNPPPPPSVATAPQPGSSYAFPGRTAALAFVLTGLTQFLLTFLREPVDPETASYLTLDPIQWLALGMIVVGTLLYLTRDLPSPRPSPHAL